MRYVWAVVAVLVLSICWNVAGEAGEINEGFDFYDPSLVVPLTRMPK